MRRIATWFLSTVTVVVLLFGYHTSTTGALSATSQPAITSGKTGSTTGTGSTSTGSTSSDAGAGSDPNAGSGSSSGSGSGSGSSSSTTQQTTSVTGAVAQTEWGPVQVALTVKAGAVTDVSVLQYPSGNSRDQEINSYALPVLISETMDAQSSQIDMVSGATVTSVGYRKSLQSALDQAGL